MKTSMEGHPPYLFGVGGHAGAGLSVTGDAGTAVTELVVRGRWSRQMCLDVYQLMRWCMAEHPAAIVIDLRDLSDLEAASASMWLAVCRAAEGLRPPARIVLCMPPTRRLAGRLRRLGAFRCLSLFPTMKQARAAVAEDLPPASRLQLSRLRPEPVAAGLAGDLVTTACGAWGLVTPAAAGRSVMIELVANAVEHAGTEMAVTISRRGAGLHLAVQDADRRLPHLVEPANGLRMIDSYASAWGVLPGPGGKVVWALVHGSRSN